MEAVAVHLKKHVVDDMVVDGNQQVHPIAGGDNVVTLGDGKALMPGDDVPGDSNMGTLLAQLAAAIPKGAAEREEGERVHREVGHGRKEPGRTAGRGRDRVGEGRNRGRWWGRRGR
ncbi:hypothetical protein GUJ93_ZPchr0012g19208 [Zizania palustris]|uniref:Uncharacterized protein n=1 Tax=Zizania palustris TaxID=103762 RepID=A0A8J5WKW8_ZIZPA|nr:hypothetical protein GUJ93_ZPchr0012g19208 [Zizania palustris]